MPAVDCLSYLIAPLSASGSPLLWSYVGLGPGQEFIPQFIALVGLAATALLAVIQWPIVVLWSRLSRFVGARKTENTADSPEFSEPTPSDGTSEQRP